MKAAAKLAVVIAAAGVAVGTAAVVRKALVAAAQVAVMVKAAAEEECLDVVAAVNLAQGTEAAALMEAEGALGGFEAGSVVALEVVVTAAGAT